MDQRRELQRYDRQHDPARVMALSDGVFAIIITLLVLEIHVPELTGGQSLREALSEVRPSFTAFLIAFLVTAIAWAGHRDLFAHIRRTDRTLVWLNILYLLPLSLLPFGAALISRYDREAVALSLYGIQVLLIAVTRLIVWLYATNRPHLLYESDQSSHQDGGSTDRGRAGGALPGRDPDRRQRTRRPACSIYGAVPVLYFIGIFVDRSTAPPGTEEDEFT